MDYQISKRWVWIGLVAIITITSAIRTRLLDLPLERDEGEYAYAGQLILQGIPPYTQVYNMKMPGIYAAYALILLVFGQTHTGIHAGLLVVNIATILVVFGLVKRLFGPLVGVISAGAFAILSLEQSVLGTFAHATHFIILPAIAGLWLLVEGMDNRKKSRFFFGALLLGLAFLMKQHGVVFMVFGALYLVYRAVQYRPFNWKDFISHISVFIIGVSTPFAVMCLILWQCGVFEKFWFWTFDYAREYVSSVPLKDGMEMLRYRMANITDSAILIWLLAAAGFVALFAYKNFRAHCVFAIGFLCFSFLAVCPGFYFRQNYFIVLLPAVALFAGLGISPAITRAARSKNVIISRIFPVLILAAIVSYSLYQQRHFFFAMTPTAASRATYGCNPFIESLEIAKYIKEHSTENDRIAILGSEPQIFFYAKRHSATGYIYAYPLMELHPYASKMQQEMIREIEAAKPRFLVYVKIPTSWLMRPQSDFSILKWSQSYADAHYNLVGVTEIMPDGTSVYKWVSNIETNRPRPDYWLAIFERKPLESMSIPSQAR